MIEIDRAIFHSAMFALTQDEQPIALELGKVEAWSLLQSVQLAFRYPLKSANVDKAATAMQRHEDRIHQGLDALKETILAGWEGRFSRRSHQEVAVAIAQSSDSIFMTISKHEAFCLICAVQLAHRHSQYQDSPFSFPASQVARSLTNVIAPDGILATVIEMGWDEQFDVEQSELPQK